MSVEKNTNFINTYIIDYMYVLNITLILVKVYKYIIMYSYNYNNRVSIMKAIIDI